MKIVKNLFLFIIFSNSYYVQTLNSRIILFLKKYPSLKIEQQESSMKDLSKKLRQPGYLLQKPLRDNIFSSIDHGANCFYLGFVGLADHNGEISFPRKHQKPILNLLITEGIQPVYILAPSTIHNWMLDKQKSSKMYQFKFSKDQETNLFYIETSKIDLPKDFMIPLETIILISNPNDVMVPIGATMTQYSSNLIVPPIYIKKNFDYAHNNLYTLSIKHYFDQVHSEYKPEDQTIAELVR